MPLSRRHTLIEHEGMLVRVYDDARTAFTVIDLFADETVTEAAKLDILMQLLFPDPQRVIDAVEDISGLLVTAVRDVCALDITGGDSTEEKILDWEKDEQYIKASIWQTYGRSLEDIAEGVSLKELGAMIALCPHETPIGQALYYRTAQPPKPTKYNSDEIQAFRERQRFWALESDTGREDAMINAWLGGR